MTITPGTLNVTITAEHHPRKVDRDEELRRLGVNIKNGICHSAFTIPEVELAATDVENALKLGRPLEPNIT